MEKLLKALKSNNVLKEKTLKNPPKTTEDFTKLAQNLGVELNENDIKSSIKQLSEEELSLIAGGDSSSEDRRHY